MATLDEFHGCCGIDILHNLDERTYSIADRLNQDVRSVVMATTSVENSAASIKALVDGGFQRLFTFDNTESGNEVTVWVRGQVEMVKKARKVPKARVPVKRRVR